MWLLFEFYLSTDIDNITVYPAHHPLFRCSVADAVGLSCRDRHSRAGGCGAGSI